MSTIRFTSVKYPESDGKPMGETDEHREEMIRLAQLLKRHFAGQKVYVSGDLLVYYEQGNPKKFVVPDVFVVKGIEPQKRRFYKLWVEHRVPDVIIEVTSRKTKKKDTTQKPELYRQLQVPEYFLFDPTQDYLDPPLQGYRLAHGGYEEVTADEQGALTSQELGMRLLPQGGHLGLFRLDTGERLLTTEEAFEAQTEAFEVQTEAFEAQTEELRAKSEALKAAEAELLRLREELGQRDRPSS